MKFFNKNKRKIEEVKEEDVKDIKQDPRSKEAIGGIADFYKVACKKCTRKLTLFIPKMLTVSRNNKAIEKFVEEKICDDCKKFLV